DCWGGGGGVVGAAAGGGGAAVDGPLVAEANDLLDASLTPPTLRHANREMGGQLLSLAESWNWAVAAVAALRAASGPWHHAPVFATLAAAAGATSGDALVVYLHPAALAVIS